MLYAVWNHNLHTALLSSSLLALVLLTLIGVDVTSKVYCFSYAAMYINTAPIDTFISVSTTLAGACGLTPLGNTCVATLVCR
jgi:hypothetical protein